MTLQSPKSPLEVVEAALDVAVIQPRRRLVRRLSVRGADLLSDVAECLRHQLLGHAASGNPVPRDAGSLAFARARRPGSVPYIADA